MRIYNMCIYIYIYINERMDSTYISYASEESCKHSSYVWQQIEDTHTHSMYVHACMYVCMYVACHHCQYKYLFKTMQVTLTSCPSCRIN